MTDDNSILEIGCGVGDTLSQLKGIDKKGLDYSENMISEAKTNFPELDFMLADASKPLGLDKKYDVIILSNVIGCFENILDVLNKFKFIFF